MYLEKTEYSVIDLYLKELEQKLMLGEKIHTQYRSYNKEKNDYIYIKCFDFHSNLDLHSIFMEEIQYSGELEFYYNKGTHTKHVY